MKAMNWREIAAVTGELRALCGGSLNRAHQPDESTLILDIRAHHQNHLLLICIGDDASRVHLVSKRPKNPPVPFGFVSLLRNRLEPARLEAITVEDGERVIVLEFGVLNPDESISRYRLVTELTGRHANAFLLDQDEMIIAAMRGNRSKKRRLTPGNSYDPVTPNPMAEVPLRFEPKDAPFPFNSGAEFYFGSINQLTEESRLHSDARRELKRQLKRVKRACKAVDDDLSQAANTDQFRKYGDLLRINFKMLKRGMEEIRVEDLIDNPQNTATIQLDPAKTPDENIAKYYKRAKKMKKALQILPARRAELEDELDRLVRLSEMLESKQDDSLVLVRKHLGLRGTEAIGKTSKATTDSQRLPYRKFVSKTGEEIRVGRSARDNDALTFRYSRGDDFWFHASGYAGSHVVVPMAKGAELHPETLLDAATLAVHYSKGKTSAEVSYTRVRFIRKPRKAPPGQVLLSRQKSRMIDVDTNRLRRLMGKTILDPH